MGMSLEVYTVKVPSSHRSGTTIVDMILPHELWAWLWRGYPSQAMTTFVGKASDVVELWKMTLEHYPTNNLKIIWRSTLSHLSLRVAYPSGFRAMMLRWGKGGVG